MAEIILSAVDAALLSTGAVNGFRYLDDYEFGFATYSEGEQALADLQGILSVYELHLNPRKTSLFELPEPIERPWATELRGFRIRPGGSPQQIDLIGYFSRAYELSRNYPDESVLRFALGRMRRNVVVQPNWPLYESTLLQIAAVSQELSQLWLMNYIATIRLAIRLVFPKWPMHSTKSFVSMQA